MFKTLKNPTFGSIVIVTIFAVALFSVISLFKPEIAKALDTGATYCVSASQSADGGTEPFDVAGQACSGTGFFSNKANSINGTAGDITYRQLYTNFGFAIDTEATITGIEFILSAASDASSWKDYDIYIVKSSSDIGTDHATSATFSVDTETRTYGSSSDLWGTTFTPAEINASTFGVSAQFQFNGSTQTRNVYVGGAQIRVYYTLASGQSGTQTMMGMSF